MCPHTLAIEGGQGGDRAIRATHVANVVDAEQHSEVAAVAKLVDLAQARGQARHLSRLHALEGLEMARRRRQFCAGSGQARFGLALLFETDVAFDLEPPQLHQQGLLGGEQLLGLGVQRT